MHTLVELSFWFFNFIRGERRRERERGDRDKKRREKTRRHQLIKQEKTGKKVEEREG
jgi:hypothetical protein